MIMDRTDINFRSKNGESLLHAACLHGGLHLVKILQSNCPLLVHQFDSKGRNVCHSAAAGGSVDVLNFLVEEGADPLCKDVDGMNLLQYACLEGNKEMAFHLMDRYSIMLRNVGKDGYTVSHCAAYGGNIDIFKRVCTLINVTTRVDSTNHFEDEEAHRDQQAYLNTLTETGETLLHMACLGGKLEMTKYLVETYPDMINEVNKCKASLAHYAAEGDNISVVQYLIDKGLDPWCRTATQQTLLHMSCISSRLEITEYLLEKYPDMINEVDNVNRTPAHYAAYGSLVSDQWPDMLRGTQKTDSHRSCIKSHLEIMKCLVKKYPDIISGVDTCNETSAHYAAESGNVSMLQYLIDHGLDPRCKTAAHETLLHISCIAGHLEITHYLDMKYPDMKNEADNCKRTPAHYAAQSNNISVLQYLIDQGMDPWCRTSTQETLLHMSCIAGRLEMTKYLVEKCPEMINMVDKRGETPGHYAVQSRNVSVLQYLIDQGLDPWCRTCTQETLLHVSSISGQLEMSKYLAEKYPDMINKVDIYKETPAHYAAYDGNVSVLRHLIDQGLDPWCTTIHQQTVLHQSCIAAQLEMSIYLVENYPDMVNEVDSSKETAAHSAAYGGNVSILQYLIDKGLDPWFLSIQQQTLLHQSCIAGQLDMSKYILAKYPAMIHEVEYCNETPGHYAVKNNNISVLQYLIEHGLDPWCRTSRQETLLHISCMAGQLEMTRYLVEKYPDMISKVTDCKRSPGHYAAENGNVSVLQYLIDHGLDPWCRTVKQETFLHMACFGDKLEMTQFLVEKYPDMINEVDNCKETPGHYAAQNSNIYVLQYLIDNGLDPRCRTDTQETLLHMSCIAGQLEMTHYLVETYHGMINKVDNCQRTPGHYAAMSGNVSLLQYLIHQSLDPWCRSATQETLLHLSCIAGKLEMSRYLVEKYPDMMNKVNSSKETPGHYAAQSSNVAVLQYLLDEGLDPLCRTATQQTLLHMSCIAGQLEMTNYLVTKYPLLMHFIMFDNCLTSPAHYAAQNGNVSVLQYLIDKGVDPWCRTVTQETLLHRSCNAGKLEMSRYLVEKYPDMMNMTDLLDGTPAHYAAQSGNVSVLQYLIDQGLDPWCRTATQETFLHMSSIAGQLEMTQYLVEKYPAMINKVSSCGKSPAIYAAQSSNVSVLQYLIGHGLDPWCRTDTQETLLHISCFAGKLQMVQYLLEKYPDMINEVNNCQETPGHYAAQRGHVSVLQFLIDKGLDPWCRTATHETLLHMSCNAGHLEMSKYLAERYPDMINDVDNCNRTSGHCAAQSGNVSLLQYLIDQGLFPWCRTATQQTLLHIALISARMKVVKYLVERYPTMISTVQFNMQF
ncbi:hypothetical protein CHS0354_020957 [Potamilus streckersoni]|uniref:Uncharacterized protein n=1 Tax=Potamilus streckersoni TaxID=2493646 RepID=A0AAE0SAW5_9BIVA|nr:hypothetical protein CHS0354_020957 [Potamilus streckersoni]